uniref:Zgc:158689 n=1 Tax=Oncorhynchus mykiss TaxID=8022 RepID=A0A8C7LMP6_ONCMY
MSRSDEVNKMTENVYKGILDQFNPSLKNFVTMGKHYEKALTGVTVAAKGYFDGLVKLGELASDSQGSKELGDTLFQMAEVHRQIQVQLEDVLKLFHSELLSQLEQKLELDIKYLTATLKKYQSERKSKSESIERCQSQLKKLRRKSQGSRHPNKYGDREMQYVELMSRRQAELDTLVAVGYRSALTEERRRYCFLVDRQCSVTKLLINYHCKVRELLSQKLSSWQQSCSQPTRLPERALNLLRHTAPQGSGASGIAELLRHAKLGAAQPEQVRTRGFSFSSLVGIHRQMLSVQEVPPLLNGGSQQQRPIPSSSQSDIPPPQHSPGPQTFRSLAATGGAIGGSGAGSPQQTSTPISASASPNANNNTSANAITSANTPTTSSTSSTVGSILPLSSPSRVEAIFAHAPGGSEGSGVGGACLLHFLPGDALSLLISEPRDGWHYGQNERTGRSPLLSKVNSTSTGQLDKLVSPGLPALTPESEEERSFPPQRVSTFRPRPYSMADSNQVSLRPKVRGEGVEWAGPPDRPALSMLMQEV